VTTSPLSLALRRWRARLVDPPTYARLSALSWSESRRLQSTGSPAPPVRAARARLVHLRSLDGERKAPVRGSFLGFAHGGNSDPVRCVESEVRAW